MNQKGYIREFLEYIIALAVAVLTYFFFTLNENVDESNFVIPLISEFNSDFVSLKPIPQTVQVIVKGNPSSLNRIVEKNMTAVVDFSGATQAGEILVPVVLQRSGSFAQIDNVEVTVSPIEVRTELDKKVGKNLQVRPALVNSLPRGYTFERSKVFPQSVRVFGPHSVLNTIDYIATSNIDLSNVTENIVMNVALQSPDALIEYTDTTSVMVNIVVQQSNVVRVFTGVVPQMRNLSSDLVVSRQIMPVAVTVQGSLLALDDEYSPRVFIDAYRYRNPGVYEVEIQMSNVEGVDLVSLEPSAFFIELRARTQYPVPSLDPRIQRQNNSSSSNN